MKSFSNNLIRRLTLALVAFLASGMALMSLLMNSPFSDWMLWGTVCLVLSLAFFVGNMLIKGTLRPVFELYDIAHKLAELHGPDKPSMISRDELAELGRTLNHVAARFQERIHALEGERAKVSAILNSMVEGVMALDHQGRILVTNLSACRILELEEGEAGGQSLLEVVRNRELADLVEWCRTLNNTERCRREVELHSPNYRILEVNAMPLPLSDNLQGIVLVLHDITELRRLERVRAEFVANVSHELRTPLTAIKGYLETLLDESPVEPVTHRRFLEVAHTHADRLGRLVNDLMNLSDIETGKVTLHLSPVSLSDVVNEVSGIFEKEAIKKSITLLNHVPPELQAQADRDRLSQILVNLVDNAVKYTSANGQIHFTVLSGGEAGLVTLRIQDTGQGIPSTDLPRITERFYRVDKARSREEGGTGLGLAIVKHLIQLHAGTLVIDSEVGKGTTIDITLPAGQLTHSF